ncbi:TIGR02391 family protein [Pseudomonas chlororaphis]|uniref:TIGR02391 family protein n=1 Tax=Pseudomonas chlororaphis TaxID=587753 RepID=UPI0009B82CDA|nr:TIGR02391 family protein [Pseudomonas chlororaphis]
MTGISHFRRYQDAYKIALEMLRQLDELDESVLLAMLERLNALIVPLVEEIDPEWAHCGSLKRHLGFMKYYLDRNSKSGCLSDIRDIVFTELPELADHIIDNSFSGSHLDVRLGQATSRLFEINDYASVVRATFPVLSSRLRRIFGVEDGSDGENLVNLIFGQGGGLNPAALSREEKTAYRNLIAGFYAVYRNKFNHEDSSPTFVQANGVVEMANSLIIDLELVAEVSMQANSE